MSSQSATTSGSGPNPQAFILPPGGGERRLLGPRRAPIELKVDGEDGSGRMAVFMEYIGPGDGIPVHRHEKEDEVIFIHRGEGLMTLGQDEHPIEAGSIIFIPKGVWHGPRNVSANGDLVMLAIFSPSGVEGYFREFSVEPGQQWPGLSEAEEIELERKYGIVYRNVEGSAEDLNGG